MSVFERLFGRGKASVTVPVMDGPFLPNQKLEGAAVIASAPEVDNLFFRDGALFGSSQARLVRFAATGEAETIETFKAPISALASRGAALAVGLDGEGIEIRGGAFDGARIPAGEEGLRCVTALAWVSDHELLACSGSSIARPHEWRRSLMQLDVSGAILKLDVTSGKAARLIGNLAWPSGIVAQGERMFVAEGWRHRVVSASITGGGVRPALAGLAGYPARLATGASGGYWLSFYAVRNQLVEFILQETKYRKRMISEIPEAFWMAPALSSGHSFKEPMQGSQLKQMGILKPYSAARSYGLVAYCDADMTPVGSFHSRADGVRHGAVSCVETDGALYVASKGSHAVVRITNPRAALSE